MPSPMPLASACGGCRSRPNGSGRRWREASQSELGSGRFEALLRGAYEWALSSQPPRLFSSSPVWQTRRAGPAAHHPPASDGPRGGPRHHTPPPCRAPHHTISDVGLIGGGHVPMPGEVSLAYNGGLFLDALPEFRRMEQLATPGGIRLSAATLRLVEGLVQVTALGPVPVKGLEEPIEVFELVGASTMRRRLQAAAARGLTSFVGQIGRASWRERVGG